MSADSNDPLEQAFEALDAGDVEGLARVLATGWDEPLALVFDVHLARLRGDLRAATERLARASERVEDDEPELHVARAELALASWDLATAEEGFRRALALEDRADLWLRLALVHDATGNEAEGDRCLDRARRLDPESLAKVRHRDPDRFAELVERAAGRLPEPFRVVLEEVGVVIDPVPQADLARGRELETPADLLGLFVGSSALERSVEASGEPPAVIYLFQRNLERFCHDPEELEAQVAITLYHELGHALGFDEEGVERMGLA